MSTGYHLMQFATRLRAYFIFTCSKLGVPDVFESCEVMQIGFISQLNLVKFLQSSQIT